MLYGSETYKNWPFSKSAYTHCHQMITQQQPKDPYGLEEVTEES